MATRAMQRFIRSFVDTNLRGQQAQRAAKEWSREDRGGPDLRILRRMVRGSTLAKDSTISASSDTWRTWRRVVYTFLAGDIERQPGPSEHLQSLLSDWLASLWGGDTVDPDPPPWAGPSFSPSSRTPRPPDSVL